jgi:antitoxin component HigA of HigAB toxin-antitoxin module
MTGSSGNSTENVPGISNDCDLEHFSDMLEALDRIERRLTPGERALEALLSRLIEDYDDRIELPEAPPYRVVAFLMEQKGLRPVDMTPVFGSRTAFF